MIIKITTCIELEEHAVEEVGALLQEAASSDPVEFNQMIDRAIAGANLHMEQQAEAILMQVAPDQGSPVKRVWIDEEAVKLAIAQFLSVKRV